MHAMAGTGRVIAGRYRLKEPIGRGAMGTVWRGWDEILDREVAVKELRISDGLPEDERAKAYQRTHREARTAARLSHPGLVTVFDVAEEDGRPWIVMELVHARSLDQVISQDGPLSPPKAAEAGRQLLAALATAHAAGVLHRDVKPSNVLLAAAGRAVLTDFGIATFQGDSRLTQTGMVMGSPGFTAPERIQGNSATPASDLWSLGATLYAAVEGHGPFDRAGGAITTMSAIINTDPPSAPAAAGLGAVIDALLRRNPAERPDATTAARMLGAIGPLPDGAMSASGYTPTVSGYAPVLPRQPESAPNSGAGAGSGVADSGSDAGAAQSPDAGAAAGAGAGAAGAAGAAGVLAGAGVGAEAAAAGAAGAVPGTAVDLPAQEDHTMPVAQPESSPAIDHSPSRSPSPVPPAPSADAVAPAPRAGSTPSGWAAPTPPPNAAPWAAVPPAGPGVTGVVPPPPGTVITGRPGRGRGLRTALIVAGVVVLLAAVAGGLLALRAHRHGGGKPANPASPTPGSSRAATPRTPAAAAGGTASDVLPTGWYWYTLTAATAGTNDGFKLAIPDGWQVSRGVGLRWYFRVPGSNTFLQIDLTPHTYPLMTAEAEYVAKRSLQEGLFPGYADQVIRPVNVRGQAGAAWGFTWQDSGVGRLRAQDLMYIAKTTAGTQSYALYMSSPVGSFGSNLATFTEEVRTFRPAP